MEARKLLRFLLDLRWAKKRRYCARRYCTTCGSLPLKKLLSRYTEEEIIEGMKKMTDEYVNQFIDHMDGKEILIFLFYKLSKTGSGYDIIKIFEGRPICNFLYQAIQFKENRELKHQRVLENQHEAHLARIERDKNNAQINIWNAIRRKDYQAIKHLLKKGIQLEEEKDGNRLKDLLIEIKAI